MVSDQYLCDRIDTFVAASLLDVLQMTPNYKVTLVVKDLQPDNFSKIYACNGRQFGLHFVTLLLFFLKQV